jgi:hypothetical protein
LHGQVKESTVIAYDHKKAERLACDFPNVISVAKATKDYDRIVNREFSNFSEHVIADNKPLEPVSAIAMDEFIWQRRNKRRDNMFKDKNYLTRVS